MLSGLGLTFVSGGESFSSYHEFMWFGVKGPDFNRLAEFETGAVVCHLYSLFQAVRLNNEEAGNRFFGFCKGAIHHHVFPGYDFALVCQRPAALELPGPIQALEPGGKPSHFVLNVFGGQVFVPTGVAEK